MNAPSASAATRDRAGGNVDQRSGGSATSASPSSASRTIAPGAQRVIGWPPSSGVHTRKTATARRVGAVMGAARNRVSTDYPLSFWLIAWMVASSRRPAAVTALRSRPWAARIARGSSRSSSARALRSALP